MRQAEILWDGRRGYKTKEAVRWKESSGKTGEAKDDKAMVLYSQKRSREDRPPDKSEVRVQFMECRDWMCKSRRRQSMRQQGKSRNKLRFYETRGQKKGEIVRWQERLLGYTKENKYTQRISHKDVFARCVTHSFMRLQVKFCIQARLLYCYYVHHKRPHARGSTLIGILST